MKVKHGKSISEIVRACVRRCNRERDRESGKNERRGKCVRKSRLQRERKGVRRVIRKGDRAER